MCMGVVFACMSVYHVCACGGQKRVLDALELEIQIVVSHEWELGIRLPYFYYGWKEVCTQNACARGGRKSASLELQL